MATKNIKGITIEIGGNTTKLESALKNVNKVVYSTNSELKQLNQALKLDPKNTELLAQKQEVLRKNITATTERLNTLKEAQRQMGDYSSLTEEQKEQYRGLSVEIAKSENALKGMKKELNATNSIDLEKLKNALKKVGEIAVDVAKKMAQVTAVIGGALAGLVTAGVKSYSQFEQLEGGAKLLFGTAGKSVEEYAESVGKSVSEVQEEYDKLKRAENTVMENSKNAYRSMGLSANQYLEQVDSYAVGLKTYLNGDSEAAAELANKIMTAQADIVAATGNTQEAVENAFRGVMRGNYTMLDNLQLGITPTKEGFQQVIDKVNEWNTAQGNATDYQLGNYADMESALVDYVKMQGLAGYAANEAAGTITGSVSSMKAAFDNFINGSGSPAQLAETITNVFKNISEAIIKLAPNILNGVVKLIQTLIPQIANLLLTMIPQLLSAITNMIDSVLTMVTSNMEGIATAVNQIITTIVTFVTTNLPKIIELGLKLIVALAKGIAESIPNLIPTIIDCIKTIIDVIIENLPLIISTGVELIVALINGLVEAMPQLAEYIPEIVQTIISVIIENLPLLISSTVQIIIALVKGLITYLPILITYIPNIITAIIKGIIDGVPKMIQSAKDLIKGMVTGFLNSHPQLATAANKIINKIKEVLTQLPNKAKQWGIDMITGLADGIKNAIGKVTKAVSNVANKIKNFLHFSRPDEGPLREYEKWMPDFMGGLAKGIDKYSYLVSDATDNVAKEMADNLSINSIVGNVDSAMRGLNAGIQSSINPVINPNITYETNYNLMAKAVREALEDMDVVMDDDKIGKFVIKKVTDEIYG